MKNRKTVLVDKKFQLRVTFSIIGLLFFLAALIIGAIGISAYDNNRKLERTVGKMGEIIVSQGHHIEALKNIDQIRNSRDLEIAAAVLSKNMGRNVDLLNSSISVLNNVTRNSTILILIMVCAVLIQGAVLYIVLIRKTNRIAGPLYVITGHMKEIINGKSPDLRPLREGDEFMELYDTFTKMVESIGEKPGA